MATSARRRFIWLVTVSYGLLALGWIFLSDRMLFALAGGTNVGWLSTAKGLFFVLATDFLLYFALCSVPYPTRGSTSAVMGGLAQRRYPLWLCYLFAVSLSLAILTARSKLVENFGEQSLLVLFMLPILLSALLGGIGPGLVATALATLGIDGLGMSPRFSLAIGDPHDQVQLVIVVLIGIVVSLLSESLQRSLRKADLHRKLLDSVISGTPDAVFIKDGQGRYLLVNQAAAGFVGKSPEEIIGNDDFALLSNPSAQAVVEKDRGVMANGVTVTHEERIQTNDGTVLDFLVTKGPIFNALGQCAGLFGISHDITARKRAELELAQAALVFESSHQGIMIVDSNKRIIRVNPAFCRITGYCPNEVLGQTPSLLSSGVHEPEFYRQMWRGVLKDGLWHGEIWNRRKNGEIYAEMLSIMVVRAKEGGPRHYIGVFTDISHIKAHEAALDRITHYDPLTGLPNRRLLTDRLHQGTMRVGRSGKSLALCLLDLDGFKEINDQHGTTAGDALLVGVAENLTNALQGDDTLARLGGDEFAVLLLDVESAEACSVVLEKLLAAASTQVVVNGVPLGVTASIGVSLYPDDQANPDTLIRHADQAMYLAKQSGKNRFHLFDPDRDRKAQARRGQLGRLRTALESGQFQLYYQPKVELQTGRLVGAEALLRWQDPEYGLRSPAEFLPVILGSDLEQPLGNWVIQQAVAQAAQWLQQRLDISVSINVSANQLLQAGFPATMREVLSRHPDLPPGNIELEVLESAAIADMEQAVEVIGLCRMMGIRFALDDFGTGYSSLTYLRKLPVQALKIDQSFIRNMLRDTEDLGIVEGVIQMANTFGLEAVAEGVETRKHASLLRQMGCRAAQGYGIAQPMPAEGIPAWAQYWDERGDWLAHGEFLKLSD